MEHKFKLSASGIKTFTSCPSSAIDDVVERHNVHVESSDHGNTVHRFIELLYNGHSAKEALDEMPAHARPFCRAIDTKSLPTMDSSRAEVAFEYDTATQTAREVVLPAPREYEWKDGCVYGTADIVSATHEVWDIKTGNAPIDHPAANTQLMFFAMCLSRIYKPLRTYKVGIVFVHDDGSVQKVTGCIDYDRIKVFESLLCMSYPPQIIVESVNSNCSMCNRRFICKTLQSQLSAFDVSLMKHSVSQHTAKVLSRVMSDYSKVAKSIVINGGDTSLVRDFDVASWSDVLREASRAGELDDSMIDEVPGVVPTKALPPELVKRLREKGLIKSRRSLKSISGKGAT